MSQGSQCSDGRFGSHLMLLKRHLEHDGQNNIKTRLINLGREEASHIGSMSLGLHSDCQE